MDAIGDPARIEPREVVAIACAAPDTQGIVIRSHSARGIAEEAPGTYKDVGAVVAAAERAGLARRVDRLRPLISIKG